MLNWMLNHLNFQLYVVDKILNEEDAKCNLSINFVEK